MAEAKYDLLLVNTHKDQRIYNKPWYKERLRTKYIKSLGPEDTSKFLQGRNWMFMKDGLDDFRDGLPPPVEGGIALKGGKGLAPNVKNSSDNLSSIKQPAARQRFNKDEICFSRVTPLQQQRRDHIEEIEYGLTQHPLALYPHLEECLPPDLFEDVVDILDPEMNLADEEDEFGEGDDESGSQPSVGGRPSPGSDDQDDKSSFSGRESVEGDSSEMEGSEEGQKVRNPYRWLPRKEEKDKKDKKKAAEKKSTSPSEDEHIKEVTKDFCNWVSELGGESNNIEESTITSLFASGYETKPALSVPIHVVELTNVPPELRMSAAVQQQPAQPQETTAEKNTKQEWTYSGNYQPSWSKFKYGAWYLAPKSWEKRGFEEPLMDPKEIKDQEMSEAKKKSNELDFDLAPMHGAKAFMEFIDRKSNYRRPDFLNRVSNIQEQQARDEQARIEAELAKQRKLQRSRQDNK